MSIASAKSSFNWNQETLSISTRLSCNVCWQQPLTTEQAVIMLTVGAQSALFIIIMQVLNYISKQQTAKHLLQSTSLNTKISSNAAAFIINNKSPHFVTAFDFILFHFAHTSCSISGQLSRSFHEHWTIMLIERCFVNCIFPQHIFGTKQKRLVICNHVWLRMTSLWAQFLLNSTNSCENGRHDKLAPVTLWMPLLSRGQTVELNHM